MTRARLALALGAAVGALAACETAPPALPAVPLAGAAIVASSDHASPDVVDRMRTWQASAPECVGDLYGGIEVHADVAPRAGEETVLASLSQGVIVIGADGAKLATSPGAACAGSQDALAAVEVLRTLDGDTLIAVVTTVGGRAESSTALALYAVGAGPQLELRFAGEITRVAGAEARTGAVTLIPGGLVYARPVGGTSLWRLDPAQRRYVEWQVLDRGRPHDERRPPSPVL